MIATQAHKNIGAIFDTSRLGYRLSLVGFRAERVAGESGDEAITTQVSEIVNKVP